MQSVVRVQTFAFVVSVQVPPSVPVQTFASAVFVQVLFFVPALHVVPFLVAAYAAVPVRGVSVLPYCFAACCKRG